MKPKPSHQTLHGRYFVGDSTKLLTNQLHPRLQGKVQLILTSPPFPLNRKKRYGNKSGVSYRRWFASLAPIFADLLKPNGSIVIELGNSWIPGRPVQSLLHLESLLGFVRSTKADLRLCQQFICHNPSRLPSPAQWVTVDRIRATDSFTHVWWMSKSDYPKANNKRVLRPYGSDMEHLLKTGKYNNGHRPSEHHVSDNGFLKRHRGSIAHNVLEIDPIDPTSDPRVPAALRFPNTQSNDFFMRRCREREIKPHPARMPIGLAAFFVHFLTDKGDLVLDPFAGSNTTGFVSELAGRRWLAIEQEKEYAEQSRIRFQDPEVRRRRRRRAKR